jgi:hypothetical protein
MRILAAVAIAGAALAAAATAAAPVTLTVASSAPAVAYGKSVTLTGVLSTKRANQPVSISALQCGTTNSKKVATVKTVTDGAYKAAVTPTVGTTYQAAQRKVKSNTVAVAVSPVLKLVRVKRGSYTASVTAGLDLKGKAILFQRYSKLKKRWVQVKRLVLATSAAGTPKPTIVSSVSFTAKAPKRARVRVAISKAQAASCYVKATSNVVRA